MTQKISLARPVINKKYKNIILKLLRNSCHWCGQLVSYKENVCTKCNSRQYKIELKNNAFYENKKKMSPVEILFRLKKISDKVYKKFNVYPKLKLINKFILTKVKVSSDKKFREISKINDKMLQRIRTNTPESRIERLWNLLQTKVNKAV